MNKFKAILKVIYYLLLAFIALVAILVIVSAFPITGNYKLMTVLSGSMEPSIKIGSIVMVKPMSVYNINDVITFGPYSKIKSPITHRIVDIKVNNGNELYITKGDANDTPDMREITKRDIVGKVFFSVPFIGYAVDFARKPYGFALLIIIPALIIIYDEARKIFGEIKRLKK